MVDVNNDQVEEVKEKPFINVIEFAPFRSILIGTTFPSLTLHNSCFPIRKELF